MSLDVSLIDASGEEVFSANITHNLTPMANYAGIYETIWHPEVGSLTAADVYRKAKDKVWDMLLDPEKFKKYDSDNGWGTYDNFMPWLLKYMKACRDNPNCDVEASV